LLEALAENERLSDPLLAAAADLNVQFARSPGLAPELYRWIAPVFEGWPSDLKRFEEVVCYLSDIGWRDHPDYRAERAFERALSLPVAGLTHQARAFLALAVATRYGGSIMDGVYKPARRLLENHFVEKAQVVGLALRLAYQISGAVAGLLPHSTLKLKKKSLVLAFDKSQGRLAGEIVEKRFQSLADALGLEPRIEFD
jgi:exopolyphosphatase/guanosine-5'-triphosphate,3'-diphosphate pyrophosphatase